IGNAQAASHLGMALGKLRHGFLHEGQFFLVILQQFVTHLRLSCTVTDRVTGFRAESKMIISSVVSACNTASTRKRILGSSGSMADWVLTFTLRMRGSNRLTASSTVRQKSCRAFCESRFRVAASGKP